MTVYRDTCTLALANPMAGFYRVMVTDAQGSDFSPFACVAVIEPGMETNGFRLSLTTTTNSTWRIECTRNLLAGADWFTLTNIAVSLSPKTIRFVDTAATNRNRLYRLVPTMN